MTVRRIYVASSWRCAHQPAVIEALRAEGHQVYDFRHPDGGTGFAWSELDPDWQSWSIGAYRDHLQDPVAKAGFESDFEAMQWADTIVLVLPCGRSAHLELGWAAGQGKDTAILLSQDGFEPELMYQMVDLLATSIDELTNWLQNPVIGSGAEIVYDLTGGKAGPVLDPDTPIRLTIESLAGEGWDGENDNTAFCWEPTDHVTVHVPTNTTEGPQ